MQKALLQIGQTNFLLSKILKILYCVHMLLMIITVNKILERFTKKIWKRQIKQSFRVEEVIQKKVVIYLSSEKITIIHLTTGLIKR